MRLGTLTHMTQYTTVEKNTVQCDDTLWYSNCTKQLFKFQKHPQRNMKRKFHDFLNKIS